MNSSGIVRRIDELGRIVIPVEIRRSLNIKEGENLEFFISKDSITLKKKSLISDNIDMLDSLNKSLETVIDGEYFITDRSKILFSSHKDLEGINIGKELADLLDVYEPSVIKNKFITKNAVLTDLYVFPYYFQNNIIGFIVLYNINDINKYNKMINFIINYIRSEISLG